MKKYQKVLAMAYPSWSNYYHAIIKRQARYVFSCGKFDFLLQKEQCGATKYFTVIELQTGTMVCKNFNSANEAKEYAKNRILEKVDVLESSVNRVLSGRLPLNGRVRRSIKKRVYIG